MGFVPLVLWGCGALFLATLVSNPEGIRMTGILGMLSPSIASLFLFGASGAVPVFGYGRWWTVLSAAWLHGGILHIVFNMMAVRDLAPATAHLYGAARTVIIYTVASTTGFLVSSTVRVPSGPPSCGEPGSRWVPPPRSCGLIGALWWYGHRSGNSQITQQVKQMALGILVFGFVIQASTTGPTSADSPGAGSRRGSWTRSPPSAATTWSSRSGAWVFPWPRWSRRSWSACPARGSSPAAFAISGAGSCASWAARRR